MVLLFLFFIIIPISNEINSKLIYLIEDLNIILLNALLLK